jgi:hypothetical protein
VDPVWDDLRIYLKLVYSDLTFITRNLKMSTRVIIVEEKGVYRK